jgi:ATP-binding protein involved in chromosome partitioning
MMEMAALREFIADTEWGSLDYLLIDLPPGTDKLPNLVSVLPQLSGTIVVTIPSGISQYVVGKSIKMAKGVLSTPIVGIVENMAGHVCEHCGHTLELFPDGHVQRLAVQLDVPYLGRIPFDSTVATAADNGTLFMVDHQNTATAKAILRLSERVGQFFATSPVSVD